MCDLIEASREQVADFTLAESIKFQIEFTRRFIHDGTAFKQPPNAHLPFFHTIGAEAYVHRMKVLRNGL